MEGKNTESGNKFCVNNTLVTELASDKSVETEESFPSGHTR